MERIIFSFKLENSIRLTPVPVIELISDSRRGIVLINHAYNFGVSLLKQYQFTSRVSQILSNSKIQIIT